MLSGQRACRGLKHVTGRAANRARTWTGTETAQRPGTLETLSMLPGCGPELLSLCVFVIESRNVDVSGRDRRQPQAEHVKWIQRCLNKSTLSQ